GSGEAWRQVLSLISSPARGRACHLRARASGLAVAHGGDPFSPLACTAKDAMKIGAGWKSRPSCGKPARPPASALAHQTSGLALIAHVAFEGSCTMSSM